MKRLRLIPAIAGLGILALIIFAMWAGSGTAPTRVPYSSFEKSLADGQVKSATVTGDQIEATLKDDTVVTTNRVQPDLAAEFDKYGVEYTGYPAASGSGWTWLLWLPML